MARILHLYRNSQPEGGEEAVSRRELIRRKYWQLWEQYQSDPEYARMYRKMDRLEWEFEEVMAPLPDQVQNVIRDFVMLCEDMNRRMLECACEEILFPEG